MKKNILKALSGLFIALIFASCSSDADTPVEVNNSQYTFENAARATVWDGPIGKFEKGAYVITADPAAIKADFNQILRDQGVAATILTLEIAKKLAANDPNETGYLLIGSDNKGTSIGVLLNYEPADNQFVLQPSDGGGFVKATSCKGCAQGCNMQFYKINGRQIPYCNENGCVYDCEKIESAM